MANENKNQSFDDATMFVVDTADVTKKIAFQASGITTGTTRTITMPDEDITLSSGGGLTGSNIKTIGSSGADYTDVSAFIADNSTPYHAVLITSITEDSDITVDGTLVLDLDRYTLTMGDFSWASAAAVNVFIRGAGVNSGAEIDYTATVSNQDLFDAITGSTTEIELSDFVVDNNSTQNGTGLGQVGIYRCRNLRFDLPDKNFTGFVNGNAGSYGDNLHFVGGGTSCYGAVSSVQQLSNIYITGTWASASNCLTISADNAWTNIVFNHSTNAALIGTGGTFASLSNVTNKSAQDLNIAVAAADNKFSNINLGQGNIDIQAQDRTQFSNMQCDTLDLTDGGSTNNLFTNCRVTDAISLAGDRNKFVNCDFIGGGAAVSGALHNIFNGCQFGADAGGGALTLTLNSGANTNIVTSCISDAAISDSGTSNTLANNIVH